METTPQPTRPAWEHRLQAVLALLGGEPVPHVTARFGMGRSIFYKWRHRALTALQGALTDHRPGPQCPANRLSPAAGSSPWWSWPSAIRPGVRRRSRPRPARRRRRPAPSNACATATQLPRLPKRPAPCRPARRLTRQVKQEARRLIEAKPWLGPERLAWELQNVAQMQISPATIKRMKHAMQQAQTPPPPPPTVALLRTPPSRIVSGMATAWRKSLTRRPGGSSIR